MAERFEAGAPVILAHTACAYAAKGHMARGYVHYRVVDAAAAEGNFAQDVALEIAAFGEQVQR